jgi:hypothetical protein
MSEAGNPAPRDLHDRLGEALRRWHFGQMRPLWTDTPEPYRAVWRAEAARLHNILRLLGVKMEIAE